ncbi:281_t:CDS:2 [Scutellospora calospora]|uniref:281_t:CDS:1 n=1 Tax=Scutellospora calospora TaxID=85575 RepID=A0ACA9L5W2_9GLOM|nr:281_t:CDS:2 [Scutellospora calospora]
MISNLNSSNSIITNNNNFSETETCNFTIPMSDLSETEEAYEQRYNERDFGKWNISSSKMAVNELLSEIHISVKL